MGLTFILWLENLNFVPVSEEEIIINSEEEDEGQEESGGWEEVPHVMVVKEVQDMAELILIPATKQLLWGILLKKKEAFKLTLTLEVYCS